MKIYLACVDHDMTMRSSPEPEKAFKTREAAQDYLDTKYPYKERNLEASLWQFNPDKEIKELELVEE